MSPRTTAASVAFSKAITSAIAADSALPGAGVPGGTRLGAGPVFGRHDVSPADCASRPPTASTLTRTTEVRSARIIAASQSTKYAVGSTAYRRLHPSSDTHRRSTTPHERSREPTPAAARHVRFARDTRAPLSASHSDTPRARGVFHRDRGQRSAHPRRRWSSRAGTSSAPTAFAPGLLPFPGYV